MKNLHNIDKSKFRPGQYIGYADCPGIWIIYKFSVGSWQGWKATNQISGKTIEAHSLTRLSALLEKEGK